MLRLLKSGEDRRYSRQRVAAALEVGWGQLGGSTGPSVLPSVTLATSGAYKDLNEGGFVGSSVFITARPRQWKAYLRSTTCAIGARGAVSWCGR